MLASLRVLKTAHARQVREDLEARGIPLAYTTVSTILGRLHAKGMVKRRRQTCRGGERYVYRYVDFERPYLHSLLRGVVSLFGSPGVVHLSEELRNLRTTEEKELRRRLKL